MPGKVYLIPAPIAEGTAPAVIPKGTLSVIASLSYFLTEDVRTARRYLAGLKLFPSVELLKFETLNKDTSVAALDELFQPVFQGVSVGIISESGCPAIADPGAMAVAFAHNKGLEVVPLTGPSSILLALMASGLNGQSFCFHGYLPVDKQAAVSKIKLLEKESARNNCTQIFIETPYRNNRLFTLLLQSLSPNTRLCVAIDLTGKAEKIRMQSIAAWKRERVTWPKLPAVFLFQACVFLFSITPLLTLPPY
ncbi:MAG: SAM-dependent methyltransferase [Cyclobacteriaceae bacterium]|nr:SAM-dependent methyltransferase [Cyclobacteriaceae bacterium]MDW8330846.1 SAM-dependent methyltransferase [Cyclobacteriaceae bacterium]